MSKAEVSASLEDVEAAVILLTNQVRELRADVDALPDDTPTPPLPPQIHSPSVTPNALPFGGGMVSISAAVENADTLLLDGEVIEAPLPWVVRVVQTMQFTFTARGPGGEISVGLPVIVIA